MLVRTVHAVAVVSELALHLRVKIHALLAVRALREKFAFFRRVVKRALLRRLLAVGEVLAPNLFCVCGVVGLRKALRALSLRLLSLHLRSDVLLRRKVLRDLACIVISRVVLGLNRAKSLKSFLFQFLRLLVSHLWLLELQVVRGLRPISIVSLRRATSLMILIVFIALFIRGLLTRMFLIEPIPTDKLIKIAVHFVVGALSKRYTAKFPAGHPRAILAAFERLALAKFAHRFVLIVVTIIRGGTVAGAAEVSAVLPKLFMRFGIIVSPIEGLDVILPRG